MQADSTFSKNSKRASFPPGLRPKHTRTTTGCLTCRRRRKKCGEEKPVCTACIRNKLECRWPDHVALTDALKNTSTQHSDSDSQLDASSPSDITFNSILPTLPTDIFRETLSLTEHSALLFEHYIEHTSPLISTRVNRENPFRSHLITLAASDSSMLHSILAVSGVHLDFNNEAAPDIRRAISVHYGRALQSIREDLSRVTSESPAACYRLALIGLLVCHVEAISTTPTSDIFPHLRAVRQLLLLAEEKSLQTPSSFDSSTKGFVLETYAYLACVSNLTPYGLMPERAIPLDHLVVNLDHLQQYPLYGAFFSCGHDIFEYIVNISVFARQCLDDLELNGTLSTSLQNTYKSLRSELESTAKSPSLNVTYPREAIAVREVFCRTLLMVLETAICGPVVNSPQSLEIIQKHMNTTILISQGIRDSHYTAIMLWPLIIGASMCVQESQRELFRQRLDHPRVYQMTQLTVAGRMIRLLWDNDDVRAFGPYGLYMIMKEHNINFGMS